MSIVTKIGDAGLTSLFGGRRVSKDDIQVQAYGSIDELSSYIGLLVTHCADQNDIAFLKQVQRDLFIIAGYLSMDRNSADNSMTCMIEEAAVCRLETRINELEIKLPKLKAFILPGGSRTSAVCHVCRTVCRRAERNIVSFHNLQDSEEDTLILQYINRLSDFLFLYARKLNIDDGVEEVIL